MVRRREHARDADPPRALPLDEVAWRRVVLEMGFAPQEARVVAGVLRGQRDKQIAEELGLGLPTVRTYLGRACRRCEAADRLELFIRVLTRALSPRDG